VVEGRTEAEGLLGFPSSAGKFFSGSELTDIVRSSRGCPRLKDSRLTKGSRPNI